MRNYLLDEMMPPLRHTMSIMNVVAALAFLLSGPVAMQWSKAQEFGIAKIVAGLYGLPVTIVGGMLAAMAVGILIDWALT